MAIRRTRWRSLTGWRVRAAVSTSARRGRCAPSGDGLLADVAFAGTAGHVLDFDDTFSAGVAHVSARRHPRRWCWRRILGRTLGETLEAYAEGFEAMATLAAASHPELYDAGWHPTAVCGPIGAAVAAAHLLELARATARERDRVGAATRRRHPRGVWLRRQGDPGRSGRCRRCPGGPIGSCRSDRGSGCDSWPLGFEAVLGARVPRASAQDDRPVSARARSSATGSSCHPSCLGTHSPIEVAARARASGHHLAGSSTRTPVVVHPVAAPSRAP